MFPTHPTLAQKVPLGSGLVKLCAFIFSRATRDCWLIYSYYQKSLHVPTALAQVPGWNLYCAQTFEQSNLGIW